MQGSNTDNASCLCDAFGCAELMSLNDEFVAIFTTPTSEQIIKKVTRCLRPYYHASQLHNAMCRHEPMRLRPDTCECRPPCRVRVRMRLCNLPRAKEAMTHQHRASLLWYPIAVLPLGRDVTG